MSAVELVKPKINIKNLMEINKPKDDLLLSYGEKLNIISDLQNNDLSVEIQYPLYPFAVKSLFPDYSKQIDNNEDLFKRIKGSIVSEKENDSMGTGTFLNVLSYFKLSYPKKFHELKQFTEPAYQREFKAFFVNDSNSITNLSYLLSYKIIYPDTISSDYLNHYWSTHKNKINSDLNMTYNNPLVKEYVYFSTLSTLKLLFPNNVSEIDIYKKFINGKNKFLDEYKSWLGEKPNKWMEIAIQAMYLKILDSENAEITKNGEIKIQEQFNIIKNINPIPLERSFV